MPDRDPRLEVADEVRALLPDDAVREAREALVAGEAGCEICKRALGGADGGDAALLALVSATKTTAVLTHAACRPSQVMYIEGEQPDSPHPDAVSFDWHALVREKSPGAVFMWETLTQIHGPEGDLQLKILRELGFQTVTGTLETLSAPPAHRLRSFYRPNAFCFLLNGRELRAHEPFEPGIWTARAGRDRRVLVVYGANLRLKDFDAEHIDARLEEGAVVAATLRFDKAGR